MLILLGSNIINWSSSNHIIAALGKMIWLWHVPTSKMFKNISCLYDVIALKTDAPSSKLAYSCEEEYGCKLKVPRQLLLLFFRYYLIGAVEYLDRVTSD